MIQIMRIDNPLFARASSPAQRLCYFNAMSHFLYALYRASSSSPLRLIYLVSDTPTSPATGPPSSPTPFLTSSSPT